MGNKQSLNPQIPQINLSEWQQIPLDRTQTAYHSQFTSYRHLQTSDLIDGYEMYFTDEEDFKIYLDAFIWRLREPNIVRTLYLKEDHQQQLCSKTFVAKVYLQSVKTRLSDITDIPYPENLYVVSCAFDGYHKLYDHLHYFRVQEGQICVNQDGLVRVWLNSDLSKNYPELSADDQGDQAAMVEQILAILDENTDKQSQPLPLIPYFRKHGSQGVGFQQAKIILNDYIREQNVVLPICFESIMQIYRINNRNESEGELFERRVQEENHIGQMSGTSKDHQPPSSSIQNTGGNILPQDSQQGQYHHQNLAPEQSQNYHHYAQPIQGINQQFVGAGMPEKSVSSRANLIPIPGQQRERGTFQGFGVPRNDRTNLSPLQIQPNPRKEDIDRRLQPFNQILNTQQRTSFVRNPPSFSASSRDFVTRNLTPQPRRPNFSPDRVVQQNPVVAHSPYKPYSPQPMGAVMFNQQRTPQQQIPILGYNVPRFPSENPRILNHFIPNQQVHHQHQRQGSQPIFINQLSQQSQPGRDYRKVDRQLSEEHIRHKSQEQLFKPLISEEKEVVGLSYQENKGQNNNKFKPLDSSNNKVANPSHERLNRFAVEVDQEIKEIQAEQNSYQSQSQSRKRVNNEPITILGESDIASSKKQMFSSGAERQNEPIVYLDPKKNSTLELQREIYQQEGDSVWNPAMRASNMQTHRAFYYTLNTAEQLDPQIAADLKKFYSF